MFGFPRRTARGARNCLSAAQVVSIGASERLRRKERRRRSACLVMPFAASPSPLNQGSDRAGTATRMGFSS